MLRYYYYYYFMGNELCKKRKMCHPVIKLNKIVQFLDVETQQKSLLHSLLVCI